MLRVSIQGAVKLLRAANDTGLQQYNKRCISLGESVKNIVSRKRPSPVTKFSSPPFGQEKDKKVTVMGWFLLTIPVTTFGLGVWQTQRKKWKEDLIHDLETRTAATPVNFPEDLSDLKTLEYCPVKLRGEFLHDRELYIGPRSIVTKDAGQGSLFSQGSSHVGYLVITPFKIEGRDEIILVNRGWVARNCIDPQTRKQGQVTGTVDLTAIVRMDEKRPQFTPEHRGGHFMYRDLPKMCSMTGASPIFVDARSDSNVVGGPIGGQTRVNLRNDHMSYLVTWFSLSAFTSFLWYRQILKRIPY